MKIFTRSEIYEIDKSVVDKKIALVDLLDSVGKSLCQWFINNIKKNQKIMILIGPGNNGADGLALAKHLNLSGYDVSTLNPTNNSIFPNASSVRSTFDEVNQYEVIVDALFGIGLNKDVIAPFDSLITAANQSHAIRVAIDIPSGLDCNTGHLYDNHFVAAHTLCIGGLKPGVLLSPGREASGEVFVINVPLLSEVMESYSTCGQTLEELSFEEFTPNPNDNKYTRGVVAICLSEDFPGAAILAAQAAQRTGAGYVMVFCPDNYLKECQVQHPDLVFKGYANQQELNILIENEVFDCLLIGSGWKNLANDLSLKIPKDKFLVIDGGLLQPDIFKHLNTTNPQNIILTPHLGELRRLIQVDDKTIVKWTLVKILEKSFKGTIIAKGYDTLISREGKYYVTRWNSPTLAIAGSGDILCGILGTMVAKTKNTLKASCLAVHLHRQLAKKHNKSITPLELLNEISNTINK